MSVVALKALRLPLAGLYWTTILLHGLAARGLAAVDVAIERRERPLFTPRHQRDKPRPNLRVVK